MQTSNFDYHLPPHLIAQKPVEPRDSSRLLVLHKATGEIEHRRFADILEYLQPGDVLVANDTRVIPARLFGRKVPSGCNSQHGKDWGAARAAQYLFTRSDRLVATRLLEWDGVAKLAMDS